MQLSNLKHFFVAAIIAVAALAPVSGFAQNAAKGNKEANEKKQNQMEDLGITQDQMDKIKNIKTDCEKAIQPLRNELKERNAKLQTAQTAARPDMTAVYKMIDDMSAIKVNIEKKEAAMHQDVRKLLTDDQRVAYDTSVFKDDKGKGGKGGGGAKGKGGKGGKGGGKGKGK